jgi:hypothetical protein
MMTEDNTEAVPLDRMEELVKLKEKRQQRLMQLRELRHGKPPSFLSTNLSSKVSPTSNGKKITRSNLSKSLPANTIPPLVQDDLKKSPSASTREGRSRGAKSKEISRSNLSESHPANAIPPLVQDTMVKNHSGETAVENSRRDSKPKKAIRSKLSKSLPASTNPPLLRDYLKKTSSAAARVEGSSQDKTSAQIPMKREESPQPRSRQSVDAPADNISLSKRSESTTRRSSSQIVHKKSNSSRSPNLYKKSTSCGVTITSDRLAPVQKLPSLKNLLHNSGDIDYTQSAEELSQLITMMQIEFNSLRDAKDHAEATANKLRTELSENQEELESQLLFLSRENERLKSDTIKLQVDLNQVNKNASKAEREKRSLISRLVKTQNEKIEVETKLGNLEVENSALKKAFTNLVNHGGGTVGIPQVDTEGLPTSGFARGA